MAKKEKQQKPIDAFKIYLNQLGIFPALVTDVQGKLNSFLVFSTTGFEQYDFKNGSASKLSEEKWENWTSATVDHLFTQSVFILKSDTRTYELKVNQKVKDVAALVKANTNIRLEEIPRKWWNKILGFRSKTKWKMAVAIVGYLVIFGTVGSIIGGEDATAPTTASQSGKTAEQIAQEKAEAAKITDSDKALLIMAQYKLFSEDELKHFAEIEDKYFNRLTDAEKTEVKADFERLYAQKKYQAWIKGQFSSWDGSHTHLVDLLKKNLNDPKSFDHEKTTYSDKGDHLIVKMTYRAKNAFGALILQNVTAKSDYKTDTITITSQND